MTRAIDKRLFNQNKKIMKEGFSSQEVCPYCNCIMIKDTGSSFSVISIDHIVASTKGGSDDLDNLIACCANCNSRKGNGTRTLLAKFNESVFLSDDDYRKLNIFLSLELRIFWARELKELLLNKEYDKALWGCLIGENNSPSKGFFEILSRDIRKVRENKTVQLENKIIKQIVKTLKEDIQRMSLAKEDVSHLNFVTYSLLS